MFDAYSVIAADTCLEKLCSGVLLCYFAQYILQASKDELEIVKRDINPTQITFIDEEKSAFSMMKNCIFIVLDKLGRCSSKIRWHSVMIISSFQ